MGQVHDAVAQEAERTCERLQCHHPPRHRRWPDACRPRGEIYRRRKIEGNLIMAHSKPFFDEAMICVLLIGAVAAASGQGCDREGAQVRRLYQIDGDICPNNNLGLCIVGEITSGMLLEPDKVSRVEVVAKDESGRECPWKSHILKDTKHGPAIAIDIDAGAAKGAVMATVTIQYMHSKYTVEARWVEAAAGCAGEWRRVGPAMIRSERM